MTAVVSKIVRTDGRPIAASDWAITRTWPLSPRIMATCTVGAAKIVLELTPDPRKKGWTLTRLELAAYNRVYHEMLAALAAKTGIGVVSLELPR